MRIGVIAQFVALAYDLLAFLGVALQCLAHGKKGGRYVLLAQDGQHLVGKSGRWAIVKGEGHQRF